MFLFHFGRDRIGTRIIGDFKPNFSIFMVSIHEYDFTLPKLEIDRYVTFSLSPTILVIISTEFFRFASLFNSLHHLSKQHKANICVIFQEMQNPAKVALRKKIKELVSQTTAESRNRQSNVISQKVKVDTLFLDVALSITFR